MSFDDLLRHTLVVKRMAAITGTAAETAGGLDTTLTADVAAGASVVGAAAVGAIAGGAFLRVGDVGETEIRTVASVLALNVTLTAPLQLAHDSGDQVRQVDDAGTASLDDYGQPVMGVVTVVTVAGRIRPLTAREVPLFSQGGAVVSTHAGDLWPLDGLTTADWIECGGQRYDITGISDAAGQGHHLVLALKAVV